MSFPNSIHSITISGRFHGNLVDTILGYNGSYEVSLIMLRNWQAEKQNLITNNHIFKVSTLRKKLKSIWQQTGRAEDEIVSIDRMKKKDVSKELYMYYHVMAVNEQRRSRFDT